MTLRAALIGFLLGILVSVGTYFNDWIIGQTQFIGNHLPISVFGIVTLLMLALNPLLNRISRNAPLKAAEIAVIAAIGLAACGWPGSGWYRGFTTTVGLPTHWQKTKADWQANNVMSYVPGGAPAIAQGHVQDWPKIVKRVVSEKDKPGTLGYQVWTNMSPSAHRAFEDAAAGDVAISRYPQLTRGLNDALSSKNFYEPGAFKQESLPAPVRDQLKQLQDEQLDTRTRTAVHRMLLSSAFPEAILPTPEGEGVLLLGGRADPFVVDTILQGRARDKQLSVGDLPWQAWWPVFRMWGGVALALGLAALCMAVIVHPQWSRRELLPYPLARFIEEAAERRHGASLPDIAKNRLFWWGLGAMVALHLINGIHAWVPAVPEISRSFDFGPLSTLFPDASRVWGTWGYLRPTLYMSVIAFSFFMTTRVAFSLGTAQLFYAAFGAALIANGLSFDTDFMVAKSSNMLRFGAYVGAAAIIVYTGRRYYANVATSAFGAKRSVDTPSYAPWAARGLVLASAIAVLLLNGAGLALVPAAAFVFLTLLLFVVMARIASETGAFFMQAWWTPIGVMTALLGFEAIGPTSFIVLAIASVLFALDPREILMPYLTNSLRLADRKASMSPAQISPWLLPMILGGFVLAGITTLYIQYNFGVGQSSGWQTEAMPTMGFKAFSQSLSEAAAQGTLAEATSMGAWDRVMSFEPTSGSIIWLTVGLALVLVTAMARLRLPWWPLHPVAFLVWGTYPIAMFGPSFLVGWLLKFGVVNTTGAKGYHSVKPLMVGVIAGELLMALFWIVYGAIYFFLTNKTPATYSVFPG